MKNKTSKLTLSPEFHEAWKKFYWKCFKRDVRRFRRLLRLEVKQPK